MTIPDYQTLMLPLLRLASDNKLRTVKEGRLALAEELSLSSEELRQLLPSGRQSVFANRVAWAKVYLERAKLLECPKRGCFQITERGIQVLDAVPVRIDVKFLNRFDEFVAFRSRKKSEDQLQEIASDDVGDVTPEERLESAYQMIQSDLAEELLAQVKAVSWEFFEVLVVDLLVKMGYGGSRHEAGKVVGKSGDEGIDGVINEDRLGLDVIYVQAKKWDGSIHRPEIQKFVGALHGKRAKKGVFITTSTFSPGAREYVQAIEPKVVLIDGHELAQLMIEFGIGVSPVSRYEVKRLDSDYFGDA